ncbi:MAG: hypothetical protein ACXV5P_07545 [Halobacteriota archaeon]
MFATFRGIVTMFLCDITRIILSVTLLHEFAASRGLINRLRVVVFGDERDGNKSNTPQTRRLPVWPALRLREHDERSELQQVCRAVGE